jgi:hypothetical protein
MAGIRPQWDASDKFFCLQAFLPAAIHPERFLSCQYLSDTDLPESSGPTFNYPWSRSGLAQGADFAGMLTRNSEHIALALPARTRAGEVNLLNLLRHAIVTEDK